MYKNFVFCKNPAIVIYLFEKTHLRGEFQSIHENVFIGESKGEEVGLGQIVDRSECQAKDLRYALLSGQPLMKFLSRISHILGIFS